MSAGLHRKEKIIFRAIDVINESGVQAMSTKRIAEKEKIAESTIFKHFGSKNEILAGVVDFYTQYDRDIVESIELKNYTGLKALKYYAEAYIKYYENYPEITAITQGLDEMRYIEGLSQKITEVVQDRRDALTRIIDQAIESGELNQAYEASTYTDVLMGAVNNIIRVWRMESFGFDLTKRCLEAIQLIIQKKL